MTDARNIGGYFHTVDELHSGDFTQSRVRLLRCGGTNCRANATLLRVLFQSRGFGFQFSGSSSLFNKLINSRHSVLHLLFKFFIKNREAGLSAGFGI